MSATIKQTLLLDFCASSDLQLQDALQKYYVLAPRFLKWLVGCSSYLRCCWGQTECHTFPTPTNRANTDRPPQFKIAAAQTLPWYSTNSNANANKIIQSTTLWDHDGLDGLASQSEWSTKNKHLVTPGLCLHICQFFTTFRIFYSPIMEEPDNKDEGHLKGFQSDACRLQLLLAASLHFVPFLADGCTLSLKRITEALKRFKSLHLCIFNHAPILLKWQ